VRVDRDGPLGAPSCSHRVGRLPGSSRCGAEPVWHHAPRGWV